VDTWDFVMDKSGAGIGLHIALYYIMP
jgi:hypothetical protein